MSRTKTGLRRKFPLQIHFNDEEKEFVARESYASKISRAEFVRTLVFFDGWKNRLFKLRVSQKSINKKDIFGA